jgi:type IV secretory pathway TrbD component
MFDDHDDGCPLCALVTAVIFAASFGVVIWFIGKIFEAME